MTNNSQNIIFKQSRRGKLFQLHMRPKTTMWGMQQIRKNPYLRRRKPKRPQVLKKNAMNTPLRTYCPPAAGTQNHRCSATTRVAPFAHLPICSFANSPHSSSLITYNSSHSFSAKERDVETNLSYFGSRYYSSDLSIWLSVDPMVSKYPSLSSYVYCADNPVKCVDPNGEEVVNAHEKPMKAAQISVDFWSKKLSECQKGSSEYHDTELKLNKAQHTLDRETKNYNATNQAINDFKSKMPEEFNEIDNLTNNGETIDVYVSMKNFGGPEMMGECVINHNGFTVYNPQLGLTGKGVEVHLNKGYSKLGATLAHEFGHISYEVNNSTSYINWLKNNGHYNENGYNGHDPKDPSGIKAYEWENTYRNR